MPKLFSKYTGPPLMEQVVSVPNLTEAWRRVRSNIHVARRDKSAGIDDVTLRDFEADWPNQMRTLADELSTGTYRPLPPRRVAIPKASGGERVIAILAVRDRIAQRAMQQVLEPVFDPILLDCSYGCRARVGVPHAIAQVTRYAERGLTWIVDADIQSYFDTIDHRLLLGMLRQRIDDVRVLQLIAQWLDVATRADASIAPAEAVAIPPETDDTTTAPPPNGPHGFGYGHGMGAPWPDPTHPYAAGQWEHPGGQFSAPWGNGGGNAFVNQHLVTAFKFAQPALVAGAKKAWPALKQVGGQRAAIAGAVVAGVAGAAVAGERWLRHQRETRQGTLQGGALSPLLANIYLHPFDLAITSNGYRLVRFMDDFVIMCTTQEEAARAHTLAQQQLAALHLALHPEKTRIVQYADGLEFLGQALVPRRSGTRLVDGVQSFTEAAERLRDQAQQQTRQWRQRRKGGKQ
jgi:RNA-directed DNA polymerase